MRKRSLYSMYHNVAMCGQLGTVTPILLQEVAPGDTWSGVSGMLMRFSPLKKAVIQDLYVDIAYYYVPHRLVYADWESFWAEGPINSPTYTLPSADVDTTESQFKCLFWRPHSSESNKDFNALRLYAYNLVYNEFWRDEQDTAKNPSDIPDTDYGHYACNKKDYWTNLRDNIGVDQNEFFFDANRGSGTQASARDVLEAIARQKIELRKQNYGTRYVDNLRAMGINVNYQMLQRPEVVAIHRTMVNITDVAASDRDWETYRVP